MRKRLLVTGLGGFVSGSVIAQGKRDWEIDAISSPNHLFEIEGVRCHRLDLRERSGLQTLFETHTPHAVIHAAAKADIDACQSHPSDAEAVNVGITHSLVELCAETGTRLVHCSTDTVFDGKSGNYTEDQPPNPVNWYGQTKVRSEEIALEGSENSIVARLALVMGLPVYGSGNSFLAKMIDHLEVGQAVKFPENEIRTPIDVITLGQALLELADNGLTGLIHLAGNTRLNRYEMSCRIAQHLGYSRDLIQATDSNSLPDRAPRPSDASLDNSKARSLLMTPMKSLIEGLDHVLQFKEEHHG
jgi:dTDP-4-dehydrorhamnose reductase